MEDLETRCGMHPDSSAVEVCQRCGVFLCQECALSFEERSVCASCLSRYALKPEVSVRARVSFLLGLAGLVLGFLPAAVGLVLAHQELGRIQRGESPPGGRTWANAGILLGWLDVTLLAVVVLGWLLSN
jgi:predicted metal-binding membrane protein